MANWRKAWPMARCLNSSEKGQSNAVLASLGETLFLVAAILALSIWMKGSANVTEQVYFHPFLFFGSGLIVFISFVKTSLVCAKSGIKSSQVSWIGLLPTWLIPAAAFVNQYIIYLSIFSTYLIVCAATELISYDAMLPSIALFTLGQFCAFFIGLSIWVLSIKIQFFSILTRLVYRRALLFLSGVVTTSFWLEKLLGPIVYYNPLLQTIEQIRNFFEPEYTPSCSINDLLMISLVLGSVSFFLVWVYRVELRSFLLVESSRDIDSTLDSF